MKYRIIIYLIILLTASIYFTYYPKSGYEMICNERLESLRFGFPKFIEDCSYLIEGEFKTIWWGKLN